VTHAVAAYIGAVISRLPHAQGPELLAEATQRTSSSLYRCTVIGESKPVRPVVLVVVALLAVALYVANFSWWLNAEVIDSEAFVASTVDVLNEPEAREATSSIMVGRLVEQLPILVVIEDGLVEIFADLLSTEELQGLLVVLGEELYARTVTGDESSLVLSLDSFREPLLAPLAVLAPELVDEVPETWFDSVSILDSGVIPNIEPLVARNGLVLFVASVSSVLLVIATVALSKRWWTAIALIGGALAFAGVASALLVPAAGSIVAGQFSDNSLDVLATSLYRGLTDTLIARSLLVLFAGLTLSGVAFIAWANQPRRGT